MATQQASNTPTSRLTLFMAFRYLFSRKEKTVINLISWISLAGISVSTTALIVVMSVYNGIGQLTQSLFNVFDPELIIEPAQGKTFRTGQINYDAITDNKYVANVSEIVEENAWLTLRQAESIVLLRGVDEGYGHASGLDTLLYDGNYLLKQPGNEADVYFMLMGYNIMARLGVNSLTNSPIAVHIPKRGTSAIGFSMDEAFSSGYAYPSGSFLIQEEIDNLYVVTHIDFVRKLMNYESDEVTALALSLHDASKVEPAKKALAETLGEDFTVKDRFQQKPLYYKVFHSERLGVFLILSLIVLISTLNLIASLSLLIINKRRDIATLSALGMQRSQIRQVFFTQGQLIALVGVVAGMLIGLATCLIQQHFGIIKIGANAIIDHFPIAMRVVDFAATFFVVMLLSSLVVHFTVRRAKI